MARLKVNFRRQFVIWVLPATILLAGCGKEQQKSEPQDSANNVPIINIGKTPNNRLFASDESQTTNRGWPEMVRHYDSVGVEHEAFYLEGPFEKEGSKDGYFRTWDWDSALALGASPAIFVGNVIALPAALIIAPLWEEQISRSVFEVVEPTHELPGEASGMARNEDISHE